MHVECPDDIDEFESIVGKMDVANISPVHMKRIKMSQAEYDRAYEFCKSVMRDCGGNCGPMTYHGTKTIKQVEYHVYETNDNLWYYPVVAP